MLNSFEESGQRTHEEEVALGISNFYDEGSETYIPSYAEEVLAYLKNQKPQKTDEGLGGNDV